MKDIFILLNGHVIIDFEILYEFSKPVERLPETLAHLRGFLFLEELVDLDYDFLVEFQATTLLFLKILQEELKLIQRFFAHLRFDLLFVIVLGLNYNEQFL